MAVFGFVRLYLYADHRLDRHYDTAPVSNDSLVSTVRDFRIAHRLLAHVASGLSRFGFVVGLPVSAWLGTAAIFFSRGVHSRRTHHLGVGVGGSSSRQRHRARFVIAQRKTQSTTRWHFVWFGYWHVHRDVHDQRWLGREDIVDLAIYR